MVDEAFQTGYGGGTACVFTVNGMYDQITYVTALAAFGMALAANPLY